MIKSLGCIIVEDQAPAQRILQRFIRDQDQLALLGTFFDARSAACFLAEQEVDLMFLDIHLPGMSGIELLKRLERPPMVVLTTAFTDYAIKGYELDVVDYLVKPFAFSRFCQAVDKAHKQVRLTANGTGSNIRFIKSGHDYVRVDFNEVLCIRTDLDYTELHLKDRVVLSPETLSAWQERLETEGFCRIHKSHLVHTDKILKITASEVHLANGMRLSIGRSYKDAFFRRYLQH